MKPAVPVILIPGLLGSKLGVRGEPGLIWGDVRSFLLPKGGGAPLRDSDDVEERGILASIPVIPWLYAVPVYCDLMARLPALHPFGYDFRKQTSAIVDDLVRFTDAVAARSGAGEVVLLGHSHGGVLASLAARSGKTRVKIRAVVALAAAFRGSLDNLRMMVDGYRVVPFGFHYDPTFHVAARSPVETLPAPGTPCFEDDAGKPLEIDLYDVASWARHELGIYAPRVRRALPASDFAAREAQLRDGLARAAALHRALAEPLPAGTAEHRVIAGAGLPTRRRAVLTRVNGGWCADFGRGSTAPGDGEVELESAVACGGAVRRIAGSHRGLLNDPETWRAVAGELAAL